MTSSPLPAPDPAALMGQVRARAHEAARNIRDQHTVSQALLRRFTRSVPGNAWQLLKIDLSSEPVRSHFSAPKGCGVIPQFVPYASASLEHYWSRIENGFRAASTPWTTARCSPAPASCPPCATWQRCTPSAACR